MSPVRAFLLGAFLLSTVGCRDDRIVTYQIPKETGSEIRLAENVPAEASDATPKWEAPSAWKAQPPSAMRLGSWIVSGEGGQADVSVIAFPGDAGGDLANVNRWRGQIKLPEIAEGEMARSLQPLESNGLSFKLVDMTSGAETDKKMRIVGAIAQHGGKSWFFKMMGDEPVVAAQKPAFLDFLKTVSFSAQEPAAGSKAEPTAAAPASAGGAPVTWKAPAGWKEQPASGMRQGSFLIEGEEGQKADVSIIALGGGVGGLLANINRWRGQLGLGPIQDSDLGTATSKIEVDGKGATFVEMSSEAPTIDNKYRGKILAAVVEQGEKTWFIKMMGAEPVVSAQKPAFVEFVKTLHFSN